MSIAPSDETARQLALHVKAAEAHGRSTISFRVRVALTTPIQALSTLMWKGLPLDVVRIERWPRVRVKLRCDVFRLWQLDRPESDVLH